MNPIEYSTIYKLSYLFVLIPTLLIIFSAFASAKQMGGKLGSGLKKVAAGTVIHSIMIITFTLLELGYKGILDYRQIQLFFLVSGVSGAVLLIMGYLQIYQIAKRLKLFTV